MIMIAGVVLLIVGLGLWFYVTVANVADGLLLLIAAWGMIFIAGVCFYDEPEACSDNLDPALIPSQSTKGSS